MDDIDALEVDEDDFSMHSESNKRMKTAVPASLIPEGWPALHNASGTVGPGISTRSFMGMKPNQQTGIVPHWTSQSSAKRQILPPINYGRSDRSRLQSPEHGYPLPSQAAPLVDAVWGNPSPSCARPFFCQPPSPPSQATIVGPQSATSTHQGDRHHILPGPAGDPKQMANEQAPSKQPYDAHRQIFSSARWHTALGTAEAARHGACSLDAIFNSKEACIMGRALATLVTDLSVASDGTGYALLKDPTCLHGSEAVIDRKLQGKYKMLGEGSLVVLGQVRIATPQGLPVVLIYAEDVIKCM